MWNLTPRRVQELCRLGLINGTVRVGKSWLIPENAPKPADRRKKQAPEHSVPLTNAFPWKTPLLPFTNIYHTPGMLQQVIADLGDRPAAAKIMEYYALCLQGDFTGAAKAVHEFLSVPRGFYGKVSAGYVLSLCAVFQGSSRLWHEAKQHMASAPCQSESDQLQRSFWLAAADCAIRHHDDFPEWFVRGCFDPLPPDAYPAAYMFYANHLYALCHDRAIGKSGEGGSLTAMLILPLALEPLVSQAKKDGLLVAELYLRLTCSAAYHNNGNDGLAIMHLDAAIALALPDRLFLPLAQFRRRLDFLMDERLQKYDGAAAGKVRSLSRKYLTGWTKLHNQELGSAVTNDLTTREYEVAKLAAYGMSNKQISDRLHISVNAVKQALRLAMDKTGAANRTELARYL